MSSSRLAHRSLSAMTNPPFRRHFLAMLATGAMSSTFFLTPLTAQQPVQTSVPPSSSAARKPALLQAPRGIDQLSTRTRVVLQLSGTLKVADPDPTSKRPPRSAEVKAESTVDFDERTRLSDDEAVAAARHYHEATVKTWVAGNATSHQLRNQCADTRLVLHQGSWQQYALDRPLMPREVDMIRLPINSVVLDQILPTGPVKADESWSPSQFLLAELFHLDAVHSSTVACKVVKAENGVATIECKGDITGTANSVPTNLKVDGNLHATLGQRCAVVTWVGMSLSEKREISQAEPGFELTARIKLIRKEEESACSDVTLDELDAIAQSNDDARWLVQFNSTAGRYQMLTERNWKTIVDTGEEAILRMIDKNQIVAQCNITRLPKLAPGQQLSLAGFQDDIRRGLDKNLDSLMDASEKKSSHNLRILRVTAVGKTQEVPVRWVYAHISDDSGRRVSLVFTMGGEAAEKFGLADEQIISSFELLTESTSQSPTPAQPISEPANETASRAAATKR